MFFPMTVSDERNVIKLILHANSEYYYHRLRHTFRRHRVMITRITIHVLTLKKSVKSISARARERVSTEFDNHHTVGCDGIRRVRFSSVFERS